MDLHFIYIVYCLFNDTTNNREYTASNGKMITEWWIQKDVEAVVAYFKVILQKSSGRTEGKSKELQSG